MKKTETSHRTVEYLFKDLDQTVSTKELDYQQTEKEKSITYHNEVFQRYKNYWKNKIYIPCRHKKEGKLKSFLMTKKGFEKYVITEQKKMKQVFTQLKDRFYREHKRTNSFSLTFVPLGYRNIGDSKTDIIVLDKLENNWNKLKLLFKKDLNCEMCYVQTLEYQNDGTPHYHILIMFNKLVFPQEIWSIISCNKYNNNTYGDINEYFNDDVKLVIFSIWDKKHLTSTFYYNLKQVLLPQSFCKYHSSFYHPDEHSSTSYFEKLMDYIVENNIFNIYELSDIDRKMIMTYSKTTYLRKRMCRFSKNLTYSVKPKDYESLNKDYDKVLNEEMNTMVPDEVKKNEILVKKYEVFREIIGEYNKQLHLTLTGDELKKGELYLDYNEHMKLVRTTIQKYITNYLKHRPDDENDIGETIWEIPDIDEMIEF